MKRFILTFAIIALITSCKTQSTIHIPQSTIIKDSISVTYRQGEVISLAENAENAEQESAASPAQSSPKAQHDGLASQAQGCYSPQSPTKLAEYKRNTIAICELGDEEPRDSYRSLAEANSLQTVPQSGATMPLEKSVKSASSARAIRIRVDTVYIERWHTRDVLQAQPVLQSQRDGPSAAGGLSAKRSQFYKNCTLGFWVLLILLLGRIAFRIMKAIYLRK